jgi:hypothetical protein
MLGVVHGRGRGGVGVPGQGGQLDPWLRDRALEGGQCGWAHVTRAQLLHLCDSDTNRLEQAIHLGLMPRPRRAHGPRFAVEV